MSFSEEETFNAFISGYKPAYLAHHEHELCVDFYIQLKGSDFPRIQIRDDMTLFFQTEQLKRRFIADAEGLEPGTADHHRALGLALGYPPIAVEHFAVSWVNRSLWEKSATYYYCGINFAGHIDDAESIAQWLWFNVPIPPTEVKVNHHGRKFSMFPPSKIVV
ncbi:hypothetical protein [Laceyella putida]|uniref:Uncharacterized protein n=1 Tax=Laceyella putida TaxID=110101 RepID=A0ABW2REY0_9BACL